MRLIDADALMEQFPCTCGCKNCGQGKDGILPCDIKDKIKATPTVEVPNEKWIPCDERLPEQNGFYLVTMRGMCKPYIRMLGFSATDKRWGYAGVTAWMDMKPYEGGERNEER